MIRKWGKEGVFAQYQPGVNSLFSELALRCVSLLVTIIATLSLSGGIGKSQILLGQPPVNDNFSDAITLTGYDLSVTSWNMWATSEPGEPAHQGHPASNSTWWRWVAPENGRAQIRSLEGLDPIYVGIYTGSALTNLVPVAVDSGSITIWTPDLSSFYATTYIFRAAAGETYYLAADTSSPNTFSLELAFGNLELIQPTILTNLTPSQPVILEYAAVDTNVAIATLQAFAGTNQLSLLTNNPYQFIYIPEREGTVPVWAIGTNTAGQTLLSLTNDLTFKPFNDNFADATVISNDFPGSFLTDIHLARFEPDEPDPVPGTLHHTVWWKWTPLYSVPTEFKLNSPGSQLVIFRGTTLTNLEVVGTVRTPVISWDPFSTFTFTPEAGDTYYILGDSLQSPYILGDGAAILSWSFVPHTLELTPAEGRQGFTGVPIELEAIWLESNSPSSGVDFVIGQMPRLFPFGPVFEIGLAGSSPSPPYHVNWIPTNGGGYYIWARCTNALGGLRESAKTFFQITLRNDNFADATVIPSAARNASFSFSTVGATIEDREPGHQDYSSAATLWWKWTPSYSGTVRLKATRELKAVPLEVYVGNSLARLQTIASNFKRTYQLGKSGALSVPVRAYQTYFIRVDDLYTDADTNITLTLEPGANGPNAEILFSLLKNSPTGPVPFSRIFMPDGSPVNDSRFLAQLYVGGNEKSLKAVGTAQPFYRDYPIYGGGVPWPVPVILPDVKAYSLVVVQVRAWDSWAGASFETAQAAGGLTGKSKVLRLMAGSEDAGPARLTGIGNFTLHGPN